MNGIHRTELHPDLPAMGSENLRSSLPEDIPPSSNPLHTSALPSWFLWMGGDGDRVPSPFLDGGGGVQSQRKEDLSGRWCPVAHRPDSPPIS